MMLRISKNQYINTDYILSLVSNDSVIQAKLLNGQVENLFSGSKEDLERKLEQISKEMNIHKTRVTK